MLPEIADAIATGQYLIDQYQEEFLAANIRRSTEEKVELEEAWAPGLAAVVGATPDWAHPFIMTPDTMPTWIDDHCRMYRPVLIDVANVGLIYAYPTNATGPVRFVPVKWGVQETDEGYVVAPTTTWAVMHSWSHFGFDEFPAALAYAYAFYQEKSRLEAEAEALNEQARQRAKEREKKRSEPTAYQRSLSWLGSAELEYELGDNLGAIATALMSLVCLLQAREAAQ